jgi:hypothetical protein
MSKKMCLIGVAALCFALAAVPAFGAKGGKGGNNVTGGGSTGGGQIDPTIGISSQQSGSITFSVNTDAATGSPALNVTSVCSDWSGNTVYSADQSVGWVASTLGYAGPFSAPSGAACVAYVHSPNSSTRLAQVSYTAP